MNIGLDIGNGINNFDSAILKNFYWKIKTKRNTGIIDKKANGIK